MGWATVELEVGIDTFRLVEEDDPTEHVMHTERYHVPQEVVDAVHATKAAGHRVIAVGTTAVRSLESAWEAGAPVSEPPVTARRFEDASDAARWWAGDIVARADATTNLYLMPGSTYHVVDGLITNFHVPRSTLMMLVSALATREQIMDAYARPWRSATASSASATRCSSSSPPGCLPAPARAAGRRRFCPGEKTAIACGVRAGIYH